MSIQLKHWKSPYKNDFYTHPVLKYFMGGKLGLVLKNIPDKNETIVDLGCGFGYLILGLVKKSKNVIGVDQNTELNQKDSKPFANPDSWEKKYKKLFDVTKELLSSEIPEKLENVKLIESKAWKLNIENSSVDVVCALDVLEHIEENKRAESLNEAFRILKNDGVFIYSVPNSVGVAYFIRSIVAKIFGMKEDPDTEDHKNYHWKNDLKKLNPSFCVEKIIGYPFGLKQISPSIIIVCKKTK